MTTVVLQNTPLQWGPCDPTTVTNPALTCAFLEVPLDYFDASAGTARLALAKVNATSERRGTVFSTQARGPGGSGIVSLSQESAYLLAVTAGLYDIVSWDPRGVGTLTTPGEIHCFSSPEEYNSFFNGTLELTGIDYTGAFTDPHDIEHLLARAPLMQRKYEEAGRKCLDGPGERYLRYVGTASTVRDLIAMTDVIEGEGALVNYIGGSYGTYLGARFVNMFPERVGKVILDGVINSAIYANHSWALHNQLVDTDAVYRGFVTGCALAGPQGCTIASAGQTPEAVHQTILGVLQAAYGADVKAGNAGSLITSYQIRAKLFNALYSPASWASVANELWPQIVGNVSAPSQSPSRRTRQDNKANATVSYTAIAIFCADDGVNPESTEMSTVFQSVVTQTQNVSHMVGGVWPQPVYYCPFWPVRGVERYQGPFKKTLVNKIALVGNTYDPVTPFSGAQGLADLLGNSANLIRLNAFGHTSAAEPSDCTVALGQAYFANGTLPEEDDVVCGVNNDFEPFPGVNTAAILANLTNFQH
ncbi:hypothetical protein DICSQDRAFT_60485 [Dichomitus squalens LYAD-421 SS1]|uniref:Peptidase S33 tripeptidyl aminopeptidase-like C-terminal domain-containing protein n=1 Tax=Dichomitus squalens (strain LYAD-421) TaxID=732165 RepID=R7SZ19_DICSQ|nr:uncharacterized protein DICSQDRAFT_60485 [Dichomitus squalens LYAD-421 SS1]EJF61449.1 hypothetical protein DICSQDRAFT_60485 [Dichomitus squalens LYAD-421 SS1]